MTYSPEQKDRLRKAYKDIPEIDIEAVIKDPEGTILTKRNGPMPPLSEVELEDLEIPYIDPSIATIPADITLQTYEENYGHKQTGSEGSASTRSTPCVTAGTGVQYSIKDVPGSSLPVAEESRGDDS